MRTNTNVLQFSSYSREIAWVKKPSFDSGSGGGDNGNMELTERVAHLETDMKDVRERLTRIEVRIDAIDSRMATKADLADAMNGMIKWIVGTAVALGTAAITIMTFVLNNATPKAPPVPPSQSAPIVIQIPSQAPAAPPKP